MNQCSDAAICSRMCIATWGAMGASGLSVRLALSMMRFLPLLSRAGVSRMKSRVTDVGSFRAKWSLVYSLQ
eukprot:2825856-Heterocapsa_arctica.AAC.1